MNRAVKDPKVTSIRKHLVKRPTNRRSNVWDKTTTKCCKIKIRFSLRAERNKRIKMKMQEDNHIWDGDHFLFGSVFIQKE
jgi:hypothetical protein